MLSPSRRLSRRSFVKAATLAGAAAAPLLRPSVGYTSTPASKPLGVGFIGMGKQVGGHVTGMLGTRGVRIVGVCDVHEGRRERFRTHVDAQHKELERKNVSPC